MLLFLLPRSLFLSLQMIRDCLLHCLMLLFLLPLSLFLSLQMIRDWVLHCPMLLFLLPLSLFLSLQMIRDWVLHCPILLFLLPLHVSVSVTADDQRLSATLPDAPISPSTACLCFCHCRWSETECYTARCSYFSFHCMSLFLSLQMIRDWVLHCPMLLFLLPRSLFLSLQMIRDWVLHCPMLLFLLPLHVSVSVTADDQRLSATLPDAPISPSTVSVSVTADDQRLCYTARCSYFSFHGLCFCHCRWSETADTTSSSPQCYPQHVHWMLPSTIQFWGRGENTVKTDTIWT